jgi:asparagine synthase (glutamine-hydrolysing)
MAPESSASVLSLSGGLDSRSVAAGLVRAGHHPTTVTFVDADEQARADVELAEQVANTLDLPWQLLTLPRPTAADLDLLLKIKGGQNYTAMALGMSYLNQIRREHGSNITYFTGDGGGRVLPAFQCPSETRTSDQLARYIVDRTHLLDLTTTSRLLGLSRDDILAEIAGVLDSYPETDLQARYLGFNIRERGIKWAMEGEDRNRAFFWSCTPFYAWSFFSHAVAVPTSMKSGNRLYRHFLQALSPETVGIVDAKRSLPVTSPAYGRTLRLISMLGRYPRLMRRAKSFLRRPRVYDQDSAILRTLRHQIANSECLSDYLDRTEVERLVLRSGRWPREVFDNLLTIALMTERYQTGTDSLASFPDDFF